jgi:hypothetical protein
VRSQTLFLLIASATLSVAACNAARPDRAIRIATGDTSHTLCSGTFVSGLDPHQLFAESVRPKPGMGLVSWALHYHVDRERRQVTTRVAGGFESRAVYRGGLRCLIVHGGELGAASHPGNSVANEQAALPRLPEIAGPVLVEPMDSALSAALDRAFSEPERPPYHSLPHPHTDRVFAHASRTIFRLAAFTDRRVGGGQPPPRSPHGGRRWSVAWPE